MNDETSTRDMAVSTKAGFDAHVADCARFREQLSRQATVTNNVIAELGDKITALQIKLAVALGVLVFAGKVVDYILMWKAGK